MTDLIYIGQQTFTRKVYKCKMFGYMTFLKKKNKTRIKIIQKVFMRRQVKLHFRTSNANNTVISLKYHFLPRFLWRFAVQYKYKWTRICSVCRNHNPVISSFMSYHLICNESNTMLPLVEQELVIILTSRTGTGHHSDWIYDFSEEEK
jgi:hypothetical protein